MGKVIVLLIVIILVLWILASCIRIVPQAYAIGIEKLVVYQVVFGQDDNFILTLIEIV